MPLCYTKNSFCDKNTGNNIKFHCRRIWNFSMHFNYLPIVYPWKSVWPSLWTIQNKSFYSMIICAKFGWRWPNALLDVFRHFRCTFVLVIIFPWKRVWSFLWTKHKSVHSRIIWNSWTDRWSENLTSENNTKSIILNGQYPLSFICLRIKLH